MPLLQSSLCERTTIPGRGGGNRQRLRALLCVSLIALSSWLPVGFAQSGDASTRGGAMTAAGSANSSLDVSVFYATNRGRERNGSAEVAYNGERGELRRGRCHVRFQPIPLINEIAAKMPFYLPSETNAMRVVEQPDAAAFQDELVAAIEQTSSKSVVVFVHGYNYGFERTCRMGAEMQRALQGRAAVLIFSWPSNGLPTDYVRDQADVEWSVPLLARLLAELGERVGRRNVQLLAHSLGSRGSIFALQRMAADAAQRPLIGPFVLLAPDFDAQTFVELVPRLVPLTTGITLYASSSDTPLKVSHQLSGYPRLGEAGEHLTVVDNVETIDVSSAGRYQIFGHEYFYFNPMVEADLVELLGAGRAAEQRPGLRPADRDGIRYWEVVGSGSP